MEFRLIDVDVPELEQGPPEQVALENARRKAFAGAALAAPGEAVLGVDTVVALVLEGESAVRAARQVIGATNPLEATTGSIRGDFAIAVGQNMVHGSDSPESGEREAKLFFGDL